MKGKEKDLKHMNLKNDKQKKKFGTLANKSGIFFALYFVQSN